MSTSSIKRQIRRFHVVVVQWTSKKCTKKCDAGAELLFWSWNLLFFWSRRCGRRRGCLSSPGDNSRHFMTPPLVSRRNDVWATTAEIPWYWRRVTTKIWFVLLVEANFSPDTTNQNWVATRHQYGISAVLAQSSFLGENSRDVTKCRLFSQSKGL